MADKKEYLFEVWRGKQCLMATDYVSCIPDDATIKAMKRAGHTIKDRRRKEVKI